MAALFYKLLDRICDDPQELPETGFVLYWGTEPLPQDYRLTGNLVLGGGPVREPDGDGGPGDGAADSPVRHRHGADFDGGVRRGGVCGFQPHGVGRRNLPPLLVSAGSGAQTELNAAQLEVFGPGTLSGHYETASVHCGGVTLSGDIDRLTVTAAGAVVELQGQVGEVLLPMDRVRLTGSGYARRVVVQGRHCAVELACGGTGGSGGLGPGGFADPVDRYGVHLRQQPQGSADGPFTNFTAGFGCTDGARTCRVTWFLNGTRLEENSSFSLREGATATCTKVFDRTRQPDRDPVFTVVLTCGQESVQAQYTVKVDRERWDYETALDTVQGVQIEAETLRRTPLYRDRDESEILRYLPQGDGSDPPVLLSGSRRAGAGPVGRRHRGMGGLERLSGFPDQLHPE